MKKKLMTAGFLAVVFLCFSLTMFSSGSQKSKVEKKQIKLGYCQAEKYYEFNYQLYYIILGFMEKDLLQGVNMDSLSKDSSTLEMWEQVCKTQKEDSLVFFEEDGYVDYSDEMYESLDDEKTGEIIQEKVDRYGIDVILTMGTSAGLEVKDFTTAKYMNFVASDPVGSGIIKNKEYSGEDRAWAQVSPESDKMSLGVMKDIFSPKVIGTVYADNEDAYVYSGGKNMDEFAEKNDIDVKVRYVEDEFKEEKYPEYREQMRKAHEELAKEQIDLYILTTSLLETRTDFEYVLEPFYEKGIPVYSINSTEDVRNGAMAAVELLDYKNIGHFAAEGMKEFYEGRSLGEIYEVYHTAPYLVINFSTVRKTNYRMPFSILVSADEICE